MQTIKIFLASSAELDADKEQVELFISRKNLRGVVSKGFE
jgi:hypothetical protein